MMEITKQKRHAKSQIPANATNREPPLKKKEHQKLAPINANEWLVNHILHPLLPTGKTSSLNILASHPFSSINLAASSLTHLFSLTCTFSTPAELLAAAPA